MNAFSPETPDGERKDTMSNTPPKAYCGGVGTAGMLMGVAGLLR